MSPTSTQTAVAELRARWKKEGFIAKGKRELVRVVPGGLHIIKLGAAGSWNTSTSVTFDVWLAAFEARTLGQPVPWPAKPLLVPEESRWHAKIGLAELSNNAYLRSVGGAGASTAATVGSVWNHWYVADRWLQQHTDLPTLASMSIEASRQSSWGEWRHFHIAALCFLELGQPERVAEMMQGEWDYYHRPEVTKDTPAAMLLGWWDRSAAWWREVAGLRAPAYDGTPGPEVPATRAPPPPRPTPRDSIWYESQLGGEWMKTRDVRDAVQRIERLLSLTTFTTWDEAELAIHAEPSLVLEQLHEYIEHGRRDLSMPERRAQTFDRAALADRGVEPDPILGQAIDAFGAPCFRRWASSETGGWSRSRFLYWWTREHLALPEDWLDFCEAHRSVLLHDRARVTLTLRAHGLSLLGDRSATPG
ncbi:MAG: hypothetical protein K8M05_19745 [Deltaproteobacteria bacterium]|nr:hypothetical protein [Kofleriaceae bacterium]